MEVPLEEAYSWLWKLIGALFQLLGQDCLRASLLCTALRSTIFFSGMGTSEIAWKAVGAALLAYGLPFPMRPSFSCEVDENFQRCLLAYSCGHVFNDILGGGFNAGVRF